MIGSASLSFTASGTLTRTTTSDTQVQIGQLTITTGAIGTTFDVTLGFQPKLVIFTWSPATGTSEPNPAIAANAVANMGAFTSLTTRYAAHALSVNGGAAMVTNRVQSNDCCIIATSSADAVAGKADINAITATGFQLIIDAVFATAVRVNYIALGGAGVQDVALGQLSLGTGTGALSLSTLAFQPTAVLFFGTGQTTVNNAVATDSVFSIGAADGSRQWAFTGGSNDGAATAQTVSYGYGTECIAFPNSTLVSTETRCAFTSFLSNGFQISRTENAVANKIVLFIALRMQKVFVDNLLTQTNTSTPIAKSVGFWPVGTLLASHGKAQSTIDVVQDHHELTLGMFTSPTSRLAKSTRDNDAAADAVAGSAISTAYAYVKQNATVVTGDYSNPASIDGTMDVVSIDAGGFTLIMDDADPAQAFVGFISFGTPISALEGATTLGFVDSADLTVSAGGAALAGSATLTLTPTGALTVAKPLIGAAALTLTPSGTLTAVKPLIGAAALQLTPSGALTVAKPLIGASALTLTPSGALSLALPLTGEAALLLTPSGALTVTKPLSGTVTVTLAPSGALSLVLPLTGMVALTFTPSGALTVLGGAALVGAAALAFSQSGALAVGKPLTGAVAITLMPSGALIVAKPLIGAAALAFTPSGALTITKALAGAAALTLTPLGALTVVRTLIGAATLTLTPSGALAVVKPLAGAAVLAFAVDSELVLIKPLIGVMALVFVVNGELHVTHPIGLTRLVQVAAEPPIVRVAADPPITRVPAEPPTVRVAADPPIAQVPAEPPIVRVLGKGS